MSGVNKPKLALGIVLLASFTAVLVAIFMPVFDGHNTLTYLDNLYNSIAKGSAYYVPKVRETVAAHETKKLDLKLAFDSVDSCERAVPLLYVAGAMARQEGTSLTFTGDLRGILDSCLSDADAMYHNRGAEVARRYGVDERQALHTWWLVLGGMEKALNLQERFADATLTANLKTRTVEAAYNFYGIEPQSIGDRWLIVLLSLVFYVVYTVWYGYGMMYLFEGLGFRLTAH